MNHYRFHSFLEALDFLMKEYQMSNENATYFLWCKSFRMGTDKGVWLRNPIQ